MNAVLLLGPSQPRKESTTQTLTTNYKITPHPPSTLSHSLFFHSLPLSLQAHKHPGFHFAEKTFCRNCCAVHFSGLQDYRLYPSLQIYTGRPVSHWPSKACNLAGLFMERGEHILPPAPLCFHDAGQPQRPLHTCASAIPCLVSMALSLWVTILLPLYGLAVGR